MTRFYSRLRSSLFPYLYSTLWQSHTKGLPMLRPMILEFQMDSKTFSIDKQFMFGDYLLVGTGDIDTIMTFDKDSVNKEFEKNTAPIYLPKGSWIDYWTGKIIESKGQWVKSVWPEYVGGPLYVKAGAIIPMTTATDSISLNNQELPHS